jgi:hypothetical protein
VLNRSRLETGTFDHVLGLREFATFGVSTEIIQRIAFCRWAVLGWTGETWINASRRRLFCGTNRNPHRSKIKRPWNKILAHFMYSYISSR